MPAFMLIVAANSVGEELFYHVAIQGALADVFVRGSDLVANAHRMAAPTGGAETDHAGSQQQGVFVSQELEKQEINEVKDMIDVNLVETFNVVKAALPGMKNRSDRKPVSIVFMSSQAGQ
ncbi:3-dehydrosphinganine reductase TSC10A-like protein, partial [Tanacetum coccineum]